MRSDGSMSKEERAQFMRDLMRASQQTASLMSVKGDFITLQ